jgi:heme-degrading monooxygenase HmoA
VPSLPESSAGFIVIWEFEVSSDSAPAFEELYGTNGEWARLFRKSSGYLKTDLLLDMHEPNRYVTIDYWRSQSEYRQFKHEFASEYLVLDNRGERLTIAERFIGAIVPSSSSNA